jgi:ubiquinone/menaquinone biosynthesis C-methylase UbiE
MRRFDAPEILDSGVCLPRDAQAVLAVLGRINRWFGGVTTTQKMLSRVVRAAEIKRLSLLEVAAGLGQGPEMVRQKLARCGIVLDVTLLDLARSHLPGGDPAATNHHARTRSVVADALKIPFADGAFDVVSCSLFAHHLDPRQLKQFVCEALRVSRRAVLINDLVRHPLHLAVAYAGFPIMWNRVAWLDGLTSVRRAYVPKEIQNILASDRYTNSLNDSLTEIPARLEITRHYLFRMGVIVWKTPIPEGSESSGRPALP